MPLLTAFTDVIGPVRLGTDPDLAKALRSSIAGRGQTLWSFGRRAGRRLRRLLGSWKRRAH